MKTENFKFGWLKDLPDYRDFLSTDVEMATRPKVVDMRANFPGIYNQGALGSCTGNGTAAVIEFAKMKQKEMRLVPSRLMIYYNARELEGSVDSDSGAMIRDCIKTVVSKGVCSEASWPYVPTQFRRKPPKFCYDEAIKNRVLEYKHVSQDIKMIETCLASGFPFVFGFTVYSSFMDKDVAKTGIMKMPQPGDSAEGGHCVVGLGYDSTKKFVWCRNSWGLDWGIAGYFKMPYDYISDQGLTSDFWKITLVD